MNYLKIRTCYDIEAEKNVKYLQGLTDSGFLETLKNLKGQNKELASSDKEEENDFFGTISISKALDRGFISTVIFLLTNYTNYIYISDSDLETMIQLKQNEMLELALKIVVDPASFLLEDLITIAIESNNVYAFNLLCLESHLIKIDFEKLCKVAIKHEREFILAQLFSKELG
jgi:hypothetical protein